MLAGEIEVYSPISSGGFPLCQRRERGKGRCTMSIERSVILTLSLFRGVFRWSPSPRLFPIRNDFLFNPEVQLVQNDPATFLRPISVELDQRNRDG